MTTRSKLQLLFLPPVLALLLGACGAPSAEDTPSPEPVSARLGLAERIDLVDEVEVRGRVVAAQTSLVSSRVMASVTRVHVRRGDAVRHGAILLEIDPTAASGGLDQARGALAQAEAAAVLAARQAERFEVLAAQDAASDLELDLARADLARARGAVDQAAGAVAAARSVAADARIVAPFSGRVTEVLVEVGDLAAPGRPLVAIEADGERRVAAAVPESLASALTLGAELGVEIDSRPDLGRVTGRVVELAPGGDPGTFTRTLEVALPPLDITAGPMTTGLAARVVMPRGSREVVVIPADAVVRRGGLELVVVRGADGAALARPVRLGRTHAAGIEVLAGLAGGEELALGLGVVPTPGTRIEEQR